MPHFYGLLLDLCRERIALDLCRERIALDLCRERIALDLCRERIALDLCRERIALDLCRERIALDLCRERIALDLCRERIAALFAECAVMFANAPQLGERYVPPFHGREYHNPWVVALCTAARAAKYGPHGGREAPHECPLSSAGAAPCCIPLDVQSGP